MHSFRSHRRLGGWLVLLAMLWGVLSPLLAQAAVDSDRSAGLDRIEICTATGMTWIQLTVADTAPGAASEESSGGQVASSMGSCVWCLIHGGAAALPAATGASAHLGVAEVIQHDAFLVLPIRQQAWARLPSRAPPTASF
ncbi:DUF2946 family protein [Hydrogenophaga sp. 5NK40-0174]|uniref:DUF2946 family protein n=1 Tax=Hydrogenophaga sp. 5NK40-0174 TaxID=3127649 RepID=UPI003107224E